MTTTSLSETVFDDTERGHIIELATALEGALDHALDGQLDLEDIHCRTCIHHFREKEREKQCHLEGKEPNYTRTIVHPPCWLLHAPLTTFQSLLRRRRHTCTASKSSTARTITCVSTPTSSTSGVATR